MRLTHTTAAAFGVLLAALGARAAHAGVPIYTFQLQARASLIDGFNVPSGSSFNSVSPVINATETVAFKLVVNGATGNAGIWTGHAGVGEVVYDAPPGRILGDAAIDAVGEIVFHQSIDFVTEGVWRYDPVPDTTTQAVPPGGPLGIQGFTSPAINDAGLIGGRVDLGASQAYVTDAAGTQEVYVEEGTDGIAFLFVAELNGSGQLAGKVRLGGLSNDQPDEIRRYEADGTYTTMAVDADSDPGSPFLSFGNGIGLSDIGLVAFTATITGGDGVFLADGVGVTPIATFEDPEIASIDFFWPAVNDGGLVVFRAFEPGGTRAIFAGDGITLRRVVGEHDIVTTDLGEARIDRPDASPVFAGNPDVDAGGDIVFNASLTAPDDPQTSYGSGVFVGFAGPDEVSVPPGGEGAPDVVLLGLSPNPFRSGARVSFSMDRSRAVMLAVFDAGGRRVRARPLGVRSRGRHAVEWRGVDDLGRLVAPGVYFVRVATAGGGVATARATRLP